MSYETAIYFKSIGETANDSGDGLTFNLHGKNAQESPPPNVYVDGIVADAEEYTIDYGDADANATITFAGSKAGKKIVCDYCWKYECGPGEDPSVFEFEKDLNVKAMKDVNGRTMIVENLVKTGGWKGVISWKHISREFWDELRRITEQPGCMIDIERTSAGAPIDLIENLYPLEYPSYKEEPGVPGLADVTLKVEQIVTGQM